MRPTRSLAMFAVSDSLHKDVREYSLVMATALMRFFRSAMRQMHDLFIFSRPARLGVAELPASSGTYEVLYNARVFLVVILVM